MRKVADGVGVVGHGFANRSIGILNDGVAREFDALTICSKEERVPEPASRETTVIGRSSPPISCQF